MVQKCVDERVFKGAGCGMYYHAGGFVDHNEMLIFVRNFQGDVLRFCIKGLGCGQFDLEHMAGNRTFAGIRQDIASSV